MGYKGKFKRAINTRYLPKILANEEAKLFLLMEILMMHTLIVGEPVRDLSSIPINSLISEVLKRMTILEMKIIFMKMKIHQKAVLLSSSVREALVSLPDEELEKYFATNTDNS